MLFQLFLGSFFPFTLFQSYFPVKKSYQSLASIYSDFICILPVKQLGSGMSEIIVFVFESFLIFLLAC